MAAGIGATTSSNEFLLNQALISEPIAMQELFKQIYGPHKTIEALRIIKELMEEETFTLEDVNLFSNLPESLRLLENFVIFVKGNDRSFKEGLIKILCALPLTQQTHEHFYALAYVQAKYWPNPRPEHRVSEKEKILITISSIQEDKAVVEANWEYLYCSLSSLWKRMQFNRLPSSQKKIKNLDFINSEIKFSLKERTSCITAKILAHPSFPESLLEHETMSLQLINDRISTERLKEIDHEEYQFRENLKTEIKAGNKSSETAQEIYNQYFNKIVQEIVTELTREPLPSTVTFFKTTGTTAEGEARAGAGTSARG